jgi:signal peptidase II
MKTLKIIKYRVFIVSLVAWLAIDLLTKCWAVRTDLTPFVFIENFFYFTLQLNTGVAFGIKLLGPTLQLIASLIILGVLIYFGFTYFLTQKRFTFLNQFLLGIIIGGAIGNLINRLQFGYVIDFIALKPIPVFNVADIGITVGLILLFILNLRTTN